MAETVRDTKTCAAVRVSGVDQYGSVQFAVSYYLSVVNWSASCHLRGKLATTHCAVAVIPDDMVVARRVERNNARTCHMGWRLL